MPGLFYFHALYKTPSPAAGTHITGIPFCIHTKQAYR